MNNAVHYEDALMIKAAWYYYFENMTQQAIADRLSISRMRVIKLLDAARQNGVIQFRLRSVAYTSLPPFQGCCGR